MSQTTNLNMIPQRNVRNLYFSQNDVGRVATVNLVDGGTPYSIPIGATVKIQATKPSGLGFSETCTFSGSTVTVTSTATMTDEAGIFPCEIQVTSGGTILGSANFNFFVERNPHPNGTTDGTAESVLNDITVAYNNAIESIEDSGGFSTAMKNAILSCFSKVAWIDQNGEAYYTLLQKALHAVTNIILNASSLLFSSVGSTQQLTATLVPSFSVDTVNWSSSNSTVATVSSNGLVTSVSDGNATITASVGDVSATCSVVVTALSVSSISAVLDATGHTFYVGDPVDDIKPYLTVTATYSDSSTATVPSGSYTLSGSLSQSGSNTITVSYEGCTDTVTVTAESTTLVSIVANYTQSGAVYDEDTLDSLENDLVVTAVYNNSSTEVVTNYTLSGTLTVGTSTITVSYSGKTTTFNVTVSASLVYYDYLQGDGTAFIDTGLLGQTYASDSYIKYAKFTILENTIDKVLFAIRNKFTTTGIWAGTGSTGYAVCFGNKWSSITGKGYGDTLELELNHPNIIVDGTTAATVTASSIAITSGTMTIPLFAGIGGQEPSETYVSRNGGYVSQFSRYKLYRFTVTEKANNTVIADMKPATYKGVAGMYDTVRDEFFANVNSTGSFTIGNDGA